MPKAGQTFRGHYTIEQKLGEGAYGRVYEATDERTGRHVAIKILKPNKKKEYKPSRVKRFKREAKVVAALDHPNIVTLFDVGKSKRGLLYIVAEFIAGEDLQVVMQRRGKFPPLAVIHIMRQIVSALKVAHKEGIVHRDVKPANIRVFEYDGDKLRIKVLDFGLAAWGGDDDDDARLTREGTSVGTPRYMSPEQLRGEDATAASDFYGVGLIAFELLFGMHTRNINYAADGRDVEVPEEEEVGRTLTNLLDRMLRYHVRERPKSASEILALLDKAREELKSGEPNDTVATKRPAYYRPNVDRDLVLEDEPSLLDRMPIWAMSILGGLLIGLAGIGVMLLTEDDPPPRRVVLPSASAAALTTAADDPPAAGRPDAELPAKPTNGGCGKQPEFSQLGELSVIDGLERHDWVTYIPLNYDPDEPTPLIVLLHDRMHPPKVSLTNSKLVDMAHNEGVIVIAPRHSFGGFDDFAEGLEGIDRHVRWTRDALCIDEEQILVVGLGTSARASYSMRCLPWVSAVVPVNWNRRSFGPHDDLCDRTVPVLSLANVEQQLSKRGTVAQDAWHEAANCRGEPTEVLSEEKSYCLSWTCDIPFESCFAGVRWGMPQRYAQRQAARREMGILTTDAPGVQFQRSMQPIVAFPIGREIWNFWKRARPAELNAVEPTQDPTP